MINYNKLKLGNHLLYKSYDIVWLGKITECTEIYLHLICMYSNAFSPSEFYSFTRGLCDSTFWSVPTDKEVNNYYKLVVFQ